MAHAIRDEDSDCFYRLLEDYLRKEFRYGDIVVSKKEFIKRITDAVYEASMIAPQKRSKE